VQLAGGIPLLLQLAAFSIAAGACSRWCSR
jgi:hypothetical protein